MARGDNTKLSRPSNETMSHTSSNDPSTSPPKLIHEPLPSNTVLKPKSSLTNLISTSNSTHRLRSSIACTRCRKSKIKCTNTGAGTTCEACSHNGRECLYPTPGSGGIKREGDGEEGMDRVKRPRVRKSEPMSDKISLGYTPTNSHHGHHIHLGSQSNGSQVTSISSLLTSIGSRTWTEVFEIFQLHYDTELSFLHGLSFLPQLAEDPTRYATMTGQEQDSRSLDLLKLGILTLTARHHNGLIKQHSQASGNNSTQSAAIATSDYFASLLKSLLFQGHAATMVPALETPDLTQIQALLMLSLYEWSTRHGSAAWIYLGLATRMAQSMEILTEDVDIPLAMSTPLTGSISSVLLHSVSQSQKDLESQEAFIREEGSRRTAWSCVILERYFSNGSSRPSSLDTNKIILQMPCGERAWIFGDRVCTPFLSGACSHHRERIQRRFNCSRKHGLKSCEESSSSTMVERGISSIPCEYDQDEGLISRYVKLVDIWSEIVHWSYIGGKTYVANLHDDSNINVSRFGHYAPWDNSSKYKNLENYLHHFIEDMPRSLRFTTQNSKAHFAQNSSPSFTLLHTLYSICKLVMLREFLPFSPVKISSPSHLDELEIPDPDRHNQKWHSNILKELFKVAHDFLELIQICKAKSKLPAGPVMGFGLYLVSFVGIYAIHFPQMDVEEAVFGKDSEASLLSDRQVRMTDALETLASIRSYLPMARYWFRTLHRAHQYYKQLNAAEQSSNRFAAVNRNTSSIKDNKTDPIGNLDTIFQDLGMAEDGNITFSIQTEQITRPTGLITDHLSSSPPQPTWNSINTNSGGPRHIDPLARPAPQVGPQSHAGWYQHRGDPVAPLRTSPPHDHASPHAISPNTLPPINSTGTYHAHPSSISPPVPPPFTNLPKETTPCFSGEDVSLFVDARSDAEIASIRSGWNMTKDHHKDPNVTASPNHRPQELRKMQTMGAGWIGVLWQWS